MEDKIKLQVGVKIFLKNKDGKYLLVKRNPEKYKKVKGEWDIVGGRINPGDTLIDNLKREVMEETKLHIISIPKLVFVQDIIPNEEKHVVRVSYVGETSGEPILDINENIEYKWLTLDELKKQENLDIYVKEILDLSLIK
jgi:ADP-ribose pyrophosphatase YjhB (NUDIX family)